MIKLKCDTGDTRDLKVTQDGVEIEDILSISIKMEDNQLIKATIEVVVEEGEYISNFPNFDEIITKNDYINGTPLHNIHGDRIC